MTLFPGDDFVEVQQYVRGRGVRREFFYIDFCCGNARALRDELFGSGWILAVVGQAFIQTVNQQGHFVALRPP